MSSSKNWPVKGLCGRCLSEFIDEIPVSHVGIFDPALWTVAPLPISLVQLSPLPCVKVKYVQTVCGCEWGGGGCCVLLETIFCRSLTLPIWPDSEPTKLLDHPKQISEGGLRQKDTCRKVRLQISFFRWQYFALVSIQLISPCMDSSLLTGFLS